MTSIRFLKPLGLIAAALALGALLVLAWMEFAPRMVPEGQPPLTTLNPGSMSRVRDAFNMGDGEVRIVAMFSPT